MKHLLRSAYVGRGLWIDRRRIGRRSCQCAEHPDRGRGADYRLECRTRRADEARRRDGGQRHQCQGRRARQEARPDRRRRRVRSETGGRGSQRRGRQEGRVCRRALLLVGLDPRLGGLQRGRRPADDAGFDQPGPDRRCGEKGLEQRLPRLRPRRCAGRRRRQVSRRPLQGKEGRDRSRQDRLRQRHRRRDHEGDERGRPQRSRCTRRSPRATRTSPP